MIQDPNHERQYTSEDYDPRYEQLKTELLELAVAPRREDTSLDLWLIVLAAVAAFTVIVLTIGKIYITQ
jgi:hypothetical protein